MDYTEVVILYQLRFDSGFLETSTPAERISIYRCIAEVIQGLGATEKLKNCCFKVLTTDGVDEVIAELTRRLAYELGEQWERFRILCIVKGGMARSVIPELQRAMIAVIQGEAI